MRNFFSKLITTLLFNIFTVQFTKVCWKLLKSVPVPSANHFLVQRNGIAWLFFFYAETGTRTWTEKKIELNVLFYVKLRSFKKQSNLTQRLMPCRAITIWYLAQFETIFPTYIVIFKKTKHFFSWNQTLETWRLFAFCCELVPFRSIVPLVDFYVCIQIII